MGMTGNTDSDGPAATWTLIRELLDLSPRNAKFKIAAIWALDTLQDKLGDEWLGRAARLSDEGLPLGLHAFGSHTHALAETLEWALRLEMSADWEGSADFLRDLIRDPRPARILHSRSQLAQASLAARLGWTVSLEPKGHGGVPADLAIAASSGLIVAEVRILTPSEFGRAQRRVAESVTDWLFWLGQEYGIWIGGQLVRDPTEGERKKIEDFVKRETPRVKQGERPQYFCDGVALQLSERSAGAPGLTSPPVQENLFDRMVRAITEKAERMQVSGGQWLHATVLTGLWAFTDWGRGPLSNKATAMSSALTAALGDRCPAGIVLTSALGLAPEDMEEQLAKSPAGISLRAGVQALRARESLILPFRPGDGQAAGDWLSIARAEGDWLSWALAEKELPTLREMLASEP